jgi:hypothetical protein
MLPAGDAAPAWPSLRELFIALLARRARAEVVLSEQSALRRGGELPTLSR